MSTLPARSIQDVPNRLSAALFFFKSSFFQTKRSLRECIDRPVRRYPTNQATAPILAESTSRIWMPGDVAELSLQAGKVHNLRVALKCLNGVEVPAGGIFSFWAQIAGPAGTKDMSRDANSGKGA